MPYSSSAYIEYICVYLCHIKISCINQVHYIHISQSTFCVIWQISLNKYGYNIKNIGHTFLILDGHINQALVHICTKTSNSKVSFMSLPHVPETNMNKYQSEISDICYIVDVLWRMHVHFIYMPHIKSMVSTM